MIYKKSRLILLSLLTVVTLAVLLLFKFSFLDKMGRPDSHVTEVAVEQKMVAEPVITNAKACIQLPVQIGEGDFSTVENTLTCILNEYIKAEARKDKKRILRLDYELKGLMYDIQVIKNHDAWKSFWQSKDRLKHQYYLMLGVRVHDTGLSYDWGLNNERVVQARVEALAWYDKFKPRFDRIKIAFLGIPNISELAHIESLYELDEQLEKLIKEANGSFDGVIPLPKYLEIGVYVSSNIYYSGSIRHVADKLLPLQGFVDPKTGAKIKVKGDRYSKLKVALEENYLTYKSLRLVPEDAEKLYELSEELGNLVKSINKEYPFERSEIFWDEKYGELGMYIGHYSDQLAYGGKLIIESYELNPNSRYREETLVAAISGAGGQSELSGVPDIALANSYLGKYPDGKYLSGVYGILATFYQNLYEELPNGSSSPSISECYSEHLAKHPADIDREVVRNKAILYYKKLLAIKQPHKEEYKKSLRNLENRKSGNIVYWCTD